MNNSNQKNMTLKQYQISSDLNQQQVIELGINLCNFLAGAVNGISKVAINPDTIIINTDNLAIIELKNVNSNLEIKKANNEVFEAPENIFSMAKDTRCDIYSIGMVMYETANNMKLPFADKPMNKMTKDDFKEITIMRLKGKKVPLIGGIDRGLNQIIEKACEFDINERYQSAQEMKNALEIEIMALKSLNKDNYTEIIKPQMNTSTDYNPDLEKSDTNGNTISKTPDEYETGVNYATQKLDYTMNQTTSGMPVNSAAPNRMPVNSAAPNRMPVNSATPNRMPVNSVAPNGMPVNSTAPNTKSKTKWVSLAGIVVILIIVFIAWRVITIYNKSESENTSAFSLEYIKNLKIVDTSQKTYEIPGESTYLVYDEIDAEIKSKWVKTYDSLIKNVSTNNIDYSTAKNFEIADYLKKQGFVFRQPAGNWKAAISYSKTIDENDTLFAIDMLEKMAALQEGETEPVTTVGEQIEYETQAADESTPYMQMAYVSNSKYFEMSFLLENYGNVLDDSQLNEISYFPHRKELSIGKEMSEFYSKAGISEDMLEWAEDEKIWKDAEGNIYSCDVNNTKGINGLDLSPDIIIKKLGTDEKTSACESMFYNGVCVGYTIYWEK